MLQHTAMDPVGFISNAFYMEGQQLTLQPSCVCVRVRMHMVSTHTHRHITDATEQLQLSTSYLGLLLPWKKTTVLVFYPYTETSATPGSNT
jgi:hypothetical protein